MKFYWFNKKCCVPECTNCSTMGNGCGKEYFDLPAEPQARSRWLKAILAEDGENLKVCVDHFKDQDIFRDKSNKRKLKVNSTPSVKLPRYVCSTCLGSKQSQNDSKIQAKICKCMTIEPIKELSKPICNKQPLKRSVSEKRTRLTWTKEEKETLFSLIKKYGEVHYMNTKVRINWNNVYSQSRNYGCFGNEKELRTAWQYLRIRATKVLNNEVLGSKLERKVAKYLTSIRGDTPKKLTDPTHQIAETDTSDDEFEELPRDEVTKDIMNTECESPKQKSNENNETMKQEHQVESKDPEDILKKEVVDSGQESCNDSENEYYSLEDVEKVYGIQIKPKMEVISLLSSDESDWE